MTMGRLAAQSALTELERAITLKRIGTVLIAKGSPGEIWNLSLEENEAVGSLVSGMARTRCTYPSYEERGVIGSECLRGGQLW